MRPLGSFFVFFIFLSVLSVFSFFFIFSCFCVLCFFFFSFFLFSFLCFFFFFIFSFFRFYFLAFLFIFFFLVSFCLRFFSFLREGGEEERAARYGGSRHQSFRVCKVNLATQKVAKKLTQHCLSLKPSDHCSATPAHWSHFARTQHPSPVCSLHVFLFFIFDDLRLRSIT